MDQLVCSSDKSVGAIAGTAYSKVVMPATWARGNALVVCSQVKNTGTTGFVPLPASGYVRSRVQMSIEADVPQPTGATTRRDPPRRRHLGVVLVTRPAARRRSEQGMIAVLTALLALALLAFAALVVDLGHVRDVRRQAQNTADSAALAAGNNLYLDSASPRMPTRVPQITQAVDAAQAYATANLGVTPAQWATCTDPGRPAGFYVPASSTPCISFDQATTPVEVRVKLPVTSVDTPLGGLLGRNRVDVVARANAKLTPNPKSKCALCILGSGLHNLQNGDVTAAVATSPSTAASA